MNILIGVAKTRTLNAPFNRIAAIAEHYSMDVKLIEGNDDQDAFITYPNPRRYNNATPKFEALRHLALDGGYGALLLIDDDQLVEPHDIGLMLEVDASVIWGLTVWRGKQRRWSACLSSTPHFVNTMLDQLPLVARKVWGSAIPVVGHGNFCTLIKRTALEAGRFARPAHDNDHIKGPRYPGGDWYFARACHEAGLSMQCHTGVLVGHIETELGEVLYPDMQDGMPTVRIEPFVDEEKRHPW